MTAARRQAGVVRSILAVALSLVALAGLAPPVAADSHDAASDVCLEVIADSLPTDAWPLVLESVNEAVAERPDLFPDAFSSVSLGTSTERVDIQAEAPTDPDSDLAAAGPCLVAGSEWTVRVGREFLDLGADRMLALAPTTPGIGSSVEVAWYPDEGRVVTTLSFAGPLDIPNGICWIDDTLVIDESTAATVSIVEQGVKTSLFAEGACGRFFDFLANGGAGGQAITLLPTSVDLGDGSTLHFVAQDVIVQEDGVMISGSVEVR